MIFIIKYTSNLKINNDNILHVIIKTLWTGLKYKQQLNW